MPEERRTLWLGDFHPHLEETFASRLHELGPRRAARGLAVVVPNRFLAIHLRRRAASLGAPSLGLRITALEDWIAELAAPREPTAGSPGGERVLPSWAAPMLLTELLASVWARSRGESYFGKVADKPGLYRALAATLRDLRDAGVDPAQLRAAAERAFTAGSVERRKLAELDFAYREYLALLHERRLLDDRARTELAMQALQVDPSRLPERLWLYGFYDLVARQRVLLGQAMKGRQAEAFFPWGRDEAAFRYAKPLRRWLEGQGLEPRSLYSQTSAGRASALERLRAGLFHQAEERANPGDEEGSLPAGDRSVRLVSLPDPSRQAAEVVRGLIAEPPASAAVLLRQEGAALPYYLSLARASGTPLHLPAGEPWRRAPAVRALGSLLELARALREEHGPPSFPRSAVEDLLGTGALEPARFGPGAHPERWPQLLRRLGLIAEPAGWQRLVARWAPPEGGEESGEESTRPLDAATPFEPTEPAEPVEPAESVESTESAEPAESAEANRDDLSERLERELRAELPQLATWVRALLAAMTELGAEVTSWKEFARRLWRLVERWLRAGAERSDLLDCLVPLADLDGVIRPGFPLAVEVVEQLLAGGRRRGPRFGGAPTVGDLMSLRGVTFERVVLPDLVERAFPRRPRQDPILLDEERAALNMAWSELAHQNGQGEESGGEPAPELPMKVAGVSGEEKLLFRLALGAARRQLVLTWPRMGDDGRALVPSTYLLEVVSRLAGREQVSALLGSGGAPAAGGERAELAGRVEVVPLSPPYPEGMALAAAGPTESARENGAPPPLAAWELDLAAIEAVTDRRQSGELSYLLAAYPRFAESLSLQESRWGFGSRHQLTEFDGLIGPRLGGAWLASRTRPDGAVALSASALERYAHCSFRFFHHDVLGLRSEAPPERRLDQDPRQLGQMAHTLLHALFEELEGEGLLPVTAETLAPAGERVEPLLDRLMAEHPRWTEEGPEVLWQARRQRLAADLRRVLLEEVREPERWRPFAYELAFGGAGEPAAVLTFGDPQAAGPRIALRGRIDRIDRAPSGHARVIDYKTGRLKPSDYKPGELRGGERLQVALYARALPELLPSIEAVHGAYVGVTSASGYARFGWSSEQLAAAGPELDRLVVAMLEGLARGEMFQVEHTYFCDQLCDLGNLCGPGRRRLIEDKGLDLRVAHGWRKAGAVASGAEGDAEGEGE